jgi:hypothetical protein
MLGRAQNFEGPGGHSRALPVAVCSASARLGSDGRRFPESRYGD